MRELCVKRRFTEECKAKIQRKAEEKAKQEARDLHALMEEYGCDSWKELALVLARKHEFPSNSKRGRKPRGPTSSDYHKLLEAQKLLETGEAKTIGHACDLVELPRRTYYNLLDDDIGYSLVHLPKDPGFRQSVDSRGVGLGPEEFLLQLYGAIADAREEEADRDEKMILEISRTILCQK